jgi:hypothetical protein
MTAVTKTEDTAAASSRSLLMNRVLQMLVDSLNYDDAVLAQFKAKFINPLYSHLYPYFIIIVVLISLLLIINLISCMMFVFVSRRQW